MVDFGYKKGKRDRYASIRYLYDFIESTDMIYFYLKHIEDRVWMTVQVPNLNNPNQLGFSLKNISSLHWSYWSPKIVKENFDLGPSQKGKKHQPLPLAI